MNELKNIELLPISAESLGVRSLAVSVKTPDLKIIIDPGCALAPNRDGYYPHPIEYENLIKFTLKILKFSKDVDYLIISHYHHDHFKPPIEDYFTLNSNFEIFDELYSNKKVLIKNPSLGCSRNSQNRAKLFISKCKKIAEKVEFADQMTFFEGDTEIKFSDPVFHGELNSKGGKIIMSQVIYQDESILHASDVQGPILNETTDWILKSNPNIAIIGGPPLYLSYFQKNLAYRINAIKNMRKILKKIPISIFDHHLLRTKDWNRIALNTLKQIGESDLRILTFASYLKIQDNLLEANRKILYDSFPVSEKFLKWLSLNEKIKKITPPPLDS
ncbi:MAG: hypothetical protein EAX96_01250 [Candidatus Lokiarchaeota archaeon]|nr:hypothetical protein [Candidatus Lokiarchaeota archaeon]